MKQSEIREIWDNQIIPKAKVMREKGSTLKEVAEALGVNQNTLWFHLKRELGSVGRKRKVVNPGRNAERNVECLVMRDKGMTLMEIGAELDFTRERARQILKNFGVTGRLSTPAYYGVSSEEMVMKDFSQKRKAFYLGLSIAQYKKYIQNVPRDIRSMLRVKMTAIDRNTHLVKHLDDNVPLMQLTVLELLDLYIQKAKELYPDCERLLSVRLLLAPRSGYMVVRKDFSLPVTVANCFIATRSELGAITGKKFGAYSDYQKSIGVCV